MKKPIDRLDCYAKLASWTGFVAVWAGMGAIFLTFIIPSKFAPYMGFVCWPFAGLSWFFWSLIRCPKCKARVWALFFHKGKFFSGKPSAEKCTACGHDLSLPVK